VALGYTDDDRFQTLASDLDPATKAPANYSVASLGEMSKNAKDHHYILGMRGLPSNFKAEAIKHYETAVRDLMSDRPKFLRVAKET